MNARIVSIARRSNSPVSGKTLKSGSEEIARRIPRGNYIVKLQHKGTVDAAAKVIGELYETA